MSETALCTHSRNESGRWKLALGACLTLCGIVGALCSTAITYSGSLRTAKLSYTFFCALCLAANLVFLKNKRAMPLGFARQMACLSVITLLYIGVLGVNRLFQATRPSVKFVLLHILLLSFATYTWLSVLRAQGSTVRQWAAKSIAALKAARFPLLICLVTVVLSLEELGTPPKWDSANYWSLLVGMRDFTFRPADVTLLRACGHECYSFNLIYALGACLFDDYALGLNVVTLGIHVASILAFWGVLTAMPQPLQKGRHLSVALYAVWPSILGPIRQTDPELLSLCAFVALIWALLRRQSIYALFFGLVLAFTKETSVVYLGGVGAGILMAECLQWLHVRKFDTPRILRLGICFAIPCVIFLIHFLAQPATWGIVNYERPVGVDLLNTFGTNKHVALVILKQLYLMNFAWLVVLGILVCLLYDMIHCHGTLLRMIVRDYWYGTLVFTVSYCVFVAFHVLYLTFTFPRYMMLNAFYLCLGLDVAVAAVKLSKASLVALTTMASSAMVAQSLISIDPVSLRVFKRVQVGARAISTSAEVIGYDSDGKILHTGAEADSLVLSPYADHNREWSYYDRLLARVFEDVNWGPNDFLLLPNEFAPYSGGPYWGYCLENYWDDAKRRIMHRYADDYDYEALTPISYRIVDGSSDFSGLEDYSRLFYIRFPYVDGFDNEAVLEKFIVVGQKSYAYRGWEAEVYELELP